MIGLVWSLEWSVALTRRRLFVLNALIPLFLVAPIAFSPAPAQHAAAVYTVLFVIFGTLGSCIPFIRDGESGLLARFTLSGIAPRSLLVERVAAGAALDTVQLIPSLIVIAMASGNITQFGSVLGTLVLALLVANLIGMWAAALARSMAEGALFAAVLSLLLLHAAGSFRTPVDGTLGAHLEVLSPFRLLREALLRVTGGGPTVPWRADLIQPLLVSLGVACLSLIAGRWIVSASGRAARG